MSESVQDKFLREIRDGETGVTIFLQNGVKLQGMVTDFDDEVIILRREQTSQLVYKNSVSTVMPPPSHD